MKEDHCSYIYATYAVAKRKPAKKFMLVRNFFSQLHKLRI